MDFVGSEICSAKEKQRVTKGKMEKRIRKRTMTCEMHVEGSRGLTNRQNQLSHRSKYLNIPCI